MRYGVRISPLKLVLYPPPIYVFPSFARNFWGKFDCAQLGKRRIQYTMELESKQNQTTYVDLYISTIPAMEGKTLLIDGAIRNHINPAPGWLAMDRIPPEWCCLVAHATSVALLATMLVSIAWKLAISGGQTNSSVEVCSSTERLCYNCTWISPREVILLYLTEC